MSAPEADTDAAPEALEAAQAVAVGTKRKAEVAADENTGAEAPPDDAPIPQVNIVLAEPLELGPKRFTSTGEVYKYFGALLSSWTMHQSFNEYEHMVLEQLLRRGHPNAEGKIGGGIKAFQVRFHPDFELSRCFFILRTDGTEEDFSYRKCLESLLPNDSAPPLPSKVRKTRTPKAGGDAPRATRTKVGRGQGAARGRGKAPGPHRAGIAKPGRGSGGRGGRGSRGGARGGRGRGRKS